MKNNLFRSAAAFSAVALAAVVFIACQKTQVAEFKKYANEGEVPRISIADAKKEYDAGSAIIVDSRPESSFTQEHIAGSINIPIGSTDDKFNTIPKDKKIILYCS